MAEEFYSRYQDSVKEDNLKRLRTPKEQVTPETYAIMEVTTPRVVKRKYTKRTTAEPAQVTKTRTFSFAWGLIKFNY